jgi:hypothetical protein
MNKKEKEEKKEIGRGGVTEELNKGEDTKE